MGYYLVLRDRLVTNIGYTLGIGLIWSGVTESTMNGIMDTLSVAYGAFAVTSSILWSLPRSSRMANSENNLESLQ